MQTPSHGDLPMLCTMNVEAPPVKFTCCHKIPTTTAQVLRCSSVFFGDYLSICLKKFGSPPGLKKINSKILDEIAKKLQIKKILDEIVRLWMKIEL